ncbi:MAG: class I tRNA ligase family protein, partial [Acidobacteriota bacterium]|nr:class I tRNA ligase family protein [Acidobacteriota bacterium]
DQYRGWFQSSFLIGIGLRGASPFRACATHGWTLDGDGRPLSKSLGNGTAPEEIIKEYGAELIRLWTASVAFHEDVRISPAILKQLSDAYRKLRNTFRYALGNLHDYNPETDAVPGDRLLEIDQWILVRAEELVSRSRIWYDEFAFHKVYRAFYDFATVDLSSIYFDVLKDRLYTCAPESAARRSAQTALHRLALALVRLFAPILCFTMEEVWSHLNPPGAKYGASVHTAYFPEPAELTEGIGAEALSRVENWTRLIGIRESVSKSLETARQEKVIGSSLEASVQLSADSEIYPLLNQYARELPGLFIVSQVDLRNHASHGTEVTISPARGTKCERCWKYTEDVGSNASVPTVCSACAGALREMYPNIDNNA